MESPCNNDGKKQTRAISMAIEYQPNRKAAWRVYWRNPYTGKKESKCFVSEKEAVKHDALVKYQLRFEKDAFFSGEQTSQEQEQITLEYAHFLYLREKQFDDKGLAWQQDCMRRIHGMIGTMQIADIDRKTLESVKKRLLADKALKPVSARAHLSVLRTILRWSFEKGLLESLPPFPRLPAAEYEHFVPPTVQEVQAMLAVAPPHLQRVLIISCQLGVRVGQSELFSIRWQDVDLDNAVLRLQAAKKRKDEPIREIPIRSSLLPLFAEWQALDQAINAEYVINYDGHQVTTIRHSWASTLRKAGIRRRIRPYDCRHAFATEAIAAGIDIGTVARLMGHASPNMILKHYQYVADEQKRRAVEALPEINLVSANLYPQILEQ